MEHVARTLVAGLARPSVVLARLWSTDANGDLRLAASAGYPTGGGSYNRIDGEFGRIAAGTGKIGQIAHTRAPFIVRSIRGDEEWLANPGWIARQAVRTFVGYPLLADGELFGVLAIFDRIPPTDAALEDFQFLADYAAARIADVQARDAVQARRGPLEAAVTPDAPDAPLHRTAPVAPILTRAQLREMEKQTLEAALARTRGKVFGPTGAAALLGMKPTTLASRIKALGLR